jgi:C4-dicarboxylate-binding protein DctP
MKTFEKRGLPALLLAVLTFVLAPSLFAAPKTIRFSYGLPEKHYVSYQLQEWGRLVTQNDSSLKVQMFPSAQLYKDADAVEAVQTGAIESAMAYTFNLARIAPLTRVFDAVYLIDSTDLEGRIIQSPIRTKIDAQLEKKNIKIIAYVVWSEEDFGIVSTKECHVPADTKGLTVRAIGPESANLLKGYGSNPTFLSGSEMYMALQRGVIQGTCATVTTSVERKLYEVAPNVTIVPYGTVVTVITMNKGYFDKLTAAQQKAIMDAGETIEGKTVACAKANLEEIWKRAEEAKIKIYRPTPDEMKLWTANLDAQYKEVLKDAPEVLALIEEVKALKIQ